MFWLGGWGRVADEAKLGAQARELGAAIRRYCWDARDRFYYTVDVQCVDRRAELIPDVKRGMAMSWSCLPLRMQVFTGFLPMWCGIATQEQARDLVQLHYLNGKTFHAEAGVRSLSQVESMYSLEFSSNPSNWLGPVWIIVNYLVWAGLKRYGFEAEAKDLADKTLRLLADDVAKSGSLNEYYHPDTGSALSHRGFMDWNLLVPEMKKRSRAVRSIETMPADMRLAMVPASMARRPGSGRGRCGGWGRGRLCRLSACLWSRRWRSRRGRRWR